MRAMPKRAAVVAWVALLGAGCATAPEQPDEVGYYAPKVYRTGSNIPVKDYGTERIEIRGPDVINPINRPLPKPPG